MGHQDLPVTDLQQPVPGHGLQGGEFGREVAQEVYAELAVALRNVQLQLGDEAHDNVAAQLVVLVDLAAAGKRQASGIHQLIVTGQVALVLQVEIADLADCGYPQSQQVIGHMQRIALEVALQPALVQRQRQLILRQHVVIHADVQVAGVLQRMADHLLQQMISHTLQDAGYLHIGMDHYVLPEDELARALQEGRLQRNFQGYSLHMADDLLGLGVSAISQIGDFYLQNERDLDAYYRLVEGGKMPFTRGCKVTGEDKLRRHIIMSLISDLRLDISDCNYQFGIDFATRFQHELASLQSLAGDGLLEISDREITVTHRGRPFLRNICMPFDAYLNAHGGDQPPPRFSATI